MLSSQRCPFFHPWTTLLFSKTSSCNNLDRKDALNIHEQKMDINKSVFIRSHATRYIIQADFHGTDARRGIPILIPAVGAIGEYSNAVVKLSSC